MALEVYHVFLTCSYSNTSTDSLYTSRNERVKNATCPTSTSYNESSRDYQRLSAFSSDPAERERAERRNGGKKKGRLTFEKIADIERPEKFRTPVVPVTELESGSYRDQPRLKPLQFAPAAIRSPPSQGKGKLRETRVERERERKSNNKENKRKKKKGKTKQLIDWQVLAFVCTRFRCSLSWLERLGTKKRGN